MVVVGITPVAVLALGVAPDSALRAFLTLSACGYLGSYLAACVSAPALLRRIGESTPGVWVLSALSTLVLGSLVVYSIFSGLRAQNWLLAGYLAALVAAVVDNAGAAGAGTAPARCGRDLRPDPGLGPAARGDVPMSPFR